MHYAHTFAEKDDNQRTSEVISRISICTFKELYEIEKCGGDKNLLACIKRTEKS